ncbi:MAG: C1 family peptidase [Anaerolineae bacterium]
MNRKRLYVMLLVVFLVGVFVRVPAHVQAEDASQFTLGLLPSTGDLPTISLPSSMSLASLPAVVDLSGGLPPVGSQGSQGSCVGWALGYYYKTFQERVERGWDVSAPSQQFSPAYVYNQRTTSSCSTSSGMSYWDGFSILRDKGAATLSAFPYNPADGCTQPSQAVRDVAWNYRSESFANIFSGAGNGNVDALKNLVAQGQPFAIAVPVYTSFYRVSYNDPVVPRPAANETFYGGHAMLVVGYDDHWGGFKVVNSWGSGWGRNGFAYLSYDFVQNTAWEGWVMTDYIDQVPSKTFEGSALLDGQPVAVGTRISARVNGETVAETTAVADGSGTSYRLVVPMDRLQAQAPGSNLSETTVTFSVSAFPAEQSSTWEPDVTEQIDLTAETPVFDHKLLLPLVRVRG